MSGFIEVGFAVIGERWCHLSDKKPEISRLSDTLLENVKYEYS